MSQFTDPLIVELVGKNIWKIDIPFEYHVGIYPSNEIIKVPKGFITNFASVPRALWWLVSPIDNHAKAAVVHDFCYYSKYQNDRKKSDDIFAEALEALGVNKLKIWCMYWSVRLFAWRRWNQN